MSKRHKAVKVARRKSKKKIGDLKAGCPDCEIEIVDKDDKVVSGLQKRCVGEKIVLKVRNKGGRGTLHDIEWNIPGTIVRNYEDNQTFARLTEIKPDDKKKAEITFYWVDGAKDRVVQVKAICTCNGKDSEKSASVQFEVKAPTLDAFTSATDTVDFDSSTAPTLVSFGITKAGIKWNWKVTVPDLMDAEIKDVQVINDITKRTAGGKKQVWTINGTKTPPGKWQLDTSNPYSLPGDFSTDGYPRTVAKGSAYQNNFTSDSPGSPSAFIRFFSRRRKSPLWRKEEKAKGRSGWLHA